MFQAKNYRRSYSGFLFYFHFWSKFTNRVFFMDRCIHRCWTFIVFDLGLMILKIKFTNHLFYVIAIYNYHLQSAVDSLINFVHMSAHIYQMYYQRFMCRRCSSANSISIFTFESLFLNSKCHF